jgi:hypothetical protein
MPPHAAPAAFDLLNFLAPLGLTALASTPVTSFVMSRDALEAALANAEANIAEASRHITRQKVHILEMGSLGLDVVKAKERLAVLEESQRLQLSHRDRVQRELDLALANSGPAGEYAFSKPR